MRAKEEEERVRMMRAGLTSCIEAIRNCEWISAMTINIFVVKNNIK